MKEFSRSLMTNASNDFSEPRDSNVFFLENKQPFVRYARNLHMNFAFARYTEFFHEKLFQEWKEDFTSLEPRDDSASTAPGFLRMAVSWYFH